MAMDDDGKKGMKQSANDRALEAVSEGEERREKDEGVKLIVALTKALPCSCGTKLALCVYIAMKMTLTTSQNIAFPGSSRSTFTS